MGVTNYLPSGVILQVRIGPVGPLPFMAELHGKKDAGDPHRPKGPDLEDHHPMTWDTWFKKNMVSI